MSLRAPIRRKTRLLMLLLLTAVYYAVPWPSIPHAGFLVGLVRREQRDHKILHDRDVTREPQGVVGLLVHLVDPLLGRLEARQQSVAELPSAS